ncbi:isochorismate synthase [Sporosarcina sp. Marseille-Q4063]|uniref:isochorismate synthase n=1 Tax=Sporosarcina sp. Marseille-Q4063 TaxID=2810514 RepID=UPI001BB00E95|nr:isochorismate synthase [Sporosarcina sp. Marseille-Q4063]QUW23219.1 isochorismate synthase [Sporosarcina sp. Marseille-Q4063]
MSRKTTATKNIGKTDKTSDYRFFSETIEIGRISPLSFLEAGSSDYKEKHFYWQNADRTLTIVGLGHAKIITSNEYDKRFLEVSKRWKELCAVLIKEEKDIAPVLFGGFSFDPKSIKASKWDGFPSAYFVVPSYQLISKNGQMFISINLITTDSNAVEEFDALREERDRLIHIAEVNEFASSIKPIVSGIDEIEKDSYLKAVQDVTDQINKGEAEKVVIARSLQMNFEQEVSSVAALHHITSEQQESYHFGLQKNGQLFFGATPERLIEIVDGQAYSACVAGSIKRGKTAMEDRELGEELLNDDKNREEHHYVVNMISNVFNKNCSDVSMPKEPKLMRIRDIQHLFTPIEGKLVSGADIFNLVEELHPTPALGGVPTNKAMEVIRREERMDRGYYAAPIGWTDSDGNGEFAVAIRSGLLDGDKAYLYAGGGIVADSEPDKEYDETWVKFRPVLRALGGKLNG